MTALFPEDPYPPVGFFAIRMGRELGLARQVMLQPAHGRRSRGKIHPTLAVHHGFDGGPGLVGDGFVIDGIAVLFRQVEQLGQDCSI